jgi:hypothetical protein
MQMTSSMVLSASFRMVNLFMDLTEAKAGGGICVHNANACSKQFEMKMK